MPDGEWITTREAAELLGVTDAHIRRLLLEGKLEGHKFGHIWAVKYISAQEYLSSRPKPGLNPEGKSLIIRHDFVYN